MNIESTASTMTKTNDNPTTSSSTVASTKDNSKTFKDEFEAVKTQDTNIPQAATTKQELIKGQENKTIAKTQFGEISKTAQETDSQAIKPTQIIENQVNQYSQSIKQNAEENVIKQTAKNKLTIENDKTNENIGIPKVSDSLTDLNSKIASLSEIKNTPNIKQNAGLKIDSKDFDKDDYCQTIKMNNKDITFFMNLVENQEMKAQAAQLTNNNVADTNFTDIKAEATQASVQVSATLLDALNNSTKTGKSIRIDFDSDVAVIMKVDKQGNISANFIPGSAAVENYLRNNIQSLRQSFDEQNLPYNELSYTNQQRQKQQKNQKENENE